VSQTPSSPRPRRIRRQALNRQRAQRAGAVVGIDAGKFRHALAVRVRGGEDSAPLEFEVNRAGFERAVAYIERHTPGLAPADVLVGIEFAGVYGFTLAHYLQERGYPIVAVLPRDTKRWKDVVHGGPHKTDKLDAITILDLAAHGQFAGFAFQRQEFADLRYLVSARASLSRRRTGTMSRIRAILQVVWPEYEKQADFSKKAYPALLRAYPSPGDFLAAPKAEVVACLRRHSKGALKEKKYEELAASARTTLALPVAQGVLKRELPLLVEQLQLYDAQIATIEGEMERIVALIPEAAYLATMPGGMATTSIATFFGTLGDPAAYSSVEEVLKISGLALVQSSSGTRKGPDRLSKRGRPAIRHMLYMLAVRNTAGSAATNPLRAKYDAYCAQHKDQGKKGLVVLMRYLLKIMFRLVKERRPYTPTPPTREHQAPLSGGAAVTTTPAPSAPEASRSVRPARTKRAEPVSATGGHTPDESIEYGDPVMTASRDRRARTRTVEAA
jgi:transposase